MKHEFSIETIEELNESIDAILALLSSKIILLKGTLGAGKTTFTKHFCKKIGVEEEVSSPTYALVNEYQSQNAKVYHFDLYRLKNAEEIFDIGFWEYIDSDCYCIIEWPEKIEEFLEENYHEICIFNDSNQRFLTFESK